MILHLCVIDKFIASYYEFVDAHFSDFQSRHRFYINGESQIYRMPQGENLYLAQNIKPAARYAWLIQNMKSADKIILHGLWDQSIIRLLTAQPWLLKKCYWVIWGGDLYTYQLGKKNIRWWWNEVFRRFVIKRIGHFITHINGDYELTKKWYGANGKWHECFMYPSNLYQETSTQSQPHDGINILLGNSADPSNNHVEILENLKLHAGEKITIYCPLSYGDLEYAHKVTSFGTTHFGEKFIALRDFMPINEYAHMLSKIDIAIFNHKRQQGMGNIITLLGMGKKVYLRKEISTWMFLQDLGITVYCNKLCDLSRNKLDISKKNSDIIANYFSELNLVLQMSKIFK